MVNSIITSLALFGASAAALSAGKAKVINQCNYEVHMCNTPSSGGGYEQIDKTLAPGESYDQPWTSLSNGNGWSIKLAKDQSFQSNILQYEYTFHNDGIIWYDLSCVDGNPWDKDWEITATDGCNPKQQAYRYATDDAYGMQSCSQDASVTVTICSGQSADNGTAVSGGSGSDSGSSSSAAAPSYSAPASSSAASAPAYSAPASSSAAPAATSAPAYTPPTYNWVGGDNQGSDYTPTTFATKVTALASNNNGDVVVTEIETQVVTQVATATAYAARAKRHQHHEHGHQHQA